jgi:uncharacterized membrane protein YeaQ/YmgE (transglycosylase-associated protein family)
MHAQDYLSAIVFGLVIGVVARLVLPGRQSIGLVATVLIGMLAAVAGTWVADHYDVHSSHRFAVGSRHYDWAVVGIQVGIAVVGVAVAAMLVKAVSTDRDR